MKDHSGLSQVFDENRSTLLRFMAARMGNYAAAEDLLQDIWIKLQANKTGGPIDNPLGYLYRTCENMVRDTKRSEARKNARDTLWAHEDSGQSDVGGDDLTPERITLERDYLQNVLAELEVLPERTRNIFIDFRVCEKTQQEISKEYGISLSAVEKHLQRAYKLVKSIREKMVRE